MNFEGEIRHISAAQTHALRGAILRPGTAREQSIYPGDDAADTFHFGAFIGEEIVGIASLYEESAPGETARALRLRGMAVSPRVQKRGVGRALIEACIAQSQACGVETLWCNARTSALGFYEALDFVRRGQEFEIPGVGPHFVCVHKIPS